MALWLFSSWVTVEKGTETTWQMIYGRFTTLTVRPYNICTTWGNYKLRGPPRPLCVKLLTYLIISLDIDC